MSPDNRDNIERWLRQSDVDYFTHFVKAWIPFNAWYRHSYGAEASEREILDLVKADGNRIRSRFIANLEGSDPDTEELRNHIAQLHRRLSADPLKDRRDARITFEHVAVGTNPKSREVSRFRGWTFSAERRGSPRFVVCEITARNGAVTVITQPGAWDETEFELLPEYMTLTVEHRARLLACYREVNPVLFRSLLADESVRNPLLMDTFKFIREPAAVFGGVVEVLYGLRNLLFHGELVPDPVTNRTYEPAYRVLRSLISTIV